MSFSPVCSFVSASELVLRDVAFVSGPAPRPGLSASEFLAFRQSRQSQFAPGASPKDTLPAVFEGSKRKASRMKFRFIGAQMSRLARK
ncbi:MAG: hypothetical protein APF80_02880 [Alphaproteobacteria bacterium BRH_c36]|nr:MAG: hypothetical protein APF80_02880 [Alphaproteobacteria bacterium BRH_c36]